MLKQKRVNCMWRINEHIPQSFGQHKCLLPGSTARGLEKGFQMLRITINTNQHARVLRLEGRLEGDWVAVLAQCFRSAMTNPRGLKLCVDLNGVTFVDAAGKAQLAEIYTQGAELLGDDIETKAIVAEIRTSRAHNEGKSQ